MAPRTLHQAMAYLGLAEQTEPVRETRHSRNEFNSDSAESFDDTRDVTYRYAEEDRFDDYVEDEYFTDDLASRRNTVSEGSVREDIFDEQDHEESYDPARSIEDRDVHGFVTARESQRSIPSTGPLHIVSSPENAPRARAVQPVAPTDTQESEEELRRITTIHPRSYNDAKIIGESFRENIPVIMNVTEMGDSEAKRLVDFSAGLAFALHGSIERVTDKVFLLTPANLEVLGTEGAEVPVALDGDSSALFDQD